MSHSIQNSDHGKALLLSLALGAIADVRQSEPRKSKRERLMMQCEDMVCDRIDIYRPNAWPPEMMAAADRILDKVNALIAEELTLCR